MDKNKSIKYLRIFIAAALAGSILYIFDFSVICQLFRGINFFWAFAALAANIFLFFISSLSIWILLSVVSRISFRKFIRHYCYAFTAGLFIPGQLGDASISLFMKKEGVSFTHGGLAYVIDKLFSLLVFFIVASIGVGIYFPRVNSFYFLLLPVISGLLLLGLYSLIVKTRYRFNLSGKIFQYLSGIIDSLRKYKNNWQIAPIIFGLDILKWLIVSFAFWAAFFAFGRTAPWPDIAVIPILSTFIGYIPVSIGGIGTVEYSAVYFFSLIGVEGSIVVSVYIFMRLIQYLIAVIASSIFGLLDTHGGQSSDGRAMF